jgi:hypothetical protein
MPKERLLQCQQEDRAKGLSENHIQQLKVYFTQCKLAAKNCFNVLQQCSKCVVGLTCHSRLLLRCDRAVLSMVGAARFHACEQWSSRRVVGLFPYAVPC